MEGQLEYKEHDLESLSNIELKTLFMETCKNGDLALCKRLVIEYNIDCSILNNSGLRFAIDYDRKNIVEWLLSVSDNNDGVLWLSVYNNNIEFVKMLINKGCTKEDKYNALMNGVINNRIDIVKYLVNLEDKDEIDLAFNNNKLLKCVR